jgi:3-phosphoshikimate 1-carboxyvinyltransferase
MKTTTTQLLYKIQPDGVLQGTIQVPGDKSISHRAVMLSAIASGISHIKGFLSGADCLATLAAFRAMGVNIECPQQDYLIIHGVGLEGLKAPTFELDLGNAGTAIRLLAGILAGQSFVSILTGDDSLKQRPMARILQPLRQMGASIEAANGDKPPLKIQGNPFLKGITYDLPIASAQIKSCLLLAGLYARGEMLIREPVSSRDHTERMLRAFHCPIKREDAVLHLSAPKTLQATSILVPGDISSAAFFLVGAIIARNSHLLLTNVGINPTRDGILTILKQMGANITVLRQHEVNEEPVADIEVKSSALKGITIDPKLVPLAIDEFPAIFIAAACAEGNTILRGAQELRVKESDRIRTMTEGLLKLGINVIEYPDGVMIEGGKLTGGLVNSYGDHRVAMAFALASLGAQSEISVSNCDNVSTSFPNFVELARTVGLKIVEERVNVE